MHCWRNGRIRTKRAAISGLLSMAVIGIVFLFAPHASADGYQHAIVTATDSGGSTGNYSWIQERKSGGSRLSEHSMMPTIVDIRAATHGRYYFIMEGGQRSQITCYNILNLDAPVWQYAAQSADETKSTRPWDLVSINDNKAYLLRYNSNDAWIVDPMAENEDDFQTGILDLSAYDDGDGAPEMCCGAVVGSKAFIALKRLDADGVPQTAYLAVIDTANDSAIDTGRDTTAGLPGIPLAVKNPVSIQYLEDTQMLYVQGAGAIAPQPDYSGGIERVNPDTYETAMVFDDGDTDNHPYGYITNMALVSATDGFFIGAASDTDQTVYHFNPSADTDTAEAVTLNASDPDYLKNKEFAGLEGGIGLDKHERLWLSNETNRKVEIIITSPNQGLYSGDGSVRIPDDSNGTAMQPGQIVFCEEPETTEEQEAQKPSSSGESGNFCFIDTLFNL